MTTYTNTNFFEVLERPLEDMTIVWTNGLHDSFTRAEALQELLSPQPSDLSSLWTWSLQFEIPIWLIALLALGLALSVLWHLRASFPAPVRHLRRNRREHDAQSLLTSLR